MKYSLRLHGPETWQISLAAKPLESRMEMHVARRQWLVYVFESFAFFDKVDIILPKVFIPQGMFLYHGPESDAQLFAVWKSDSHLGLSFSRYFLNYLTGQSSFPVVAYIRPASFLDAGLSSRVFLVSSSTGLCNKFAAIRIFTHSKVPFLQISKISLPLRHMVHHEFEPTLCFWRHWGSFWLNTPERYNVQMSFSSTGGWCSTSPFPSFFSCTNAALKDWLALENSLSFMISIWPSYVSFKWRLMPPRILTSDPLL